MSQSLPYLNYEQTNGLGGSVTSGPASSSTVVHQTTGLSDVNEGQAGSTGAVRKSVNVNNKNNKAKTFYNGKPKRTNNKWVPHQFSHKRNNTFRNSEEFNRDFTHNQDNIQSTQMRSTYDSYYENTNSNRSNDRQNFYDDRKTQNNYEETPRQSESTFNRNRKYNNGGEKHFYNEDNMKKNFDVSRRNGHYKGKEENNSHYGKEELDVPPPYTNGNHRNRNSRYYNEETGYGDSYAPKSNQNSRFRNGRQRNFQMQEDEPFDTSRYKSSGNYRNSYRNNFDQKRNRNNGKESKKNNVEIASQRERLEGMIKQRTLECLVCCELLKHNNEVWSCKQCYHILHLNCTQAWAKSSKVDNGWRCPACQNVCKDIPTAYFCFCGKLRNPRNIPGCTAHSCGEVCLRDRRNCDHRCSILCHPGPCPDCTILVNKSCGCGKTKQQVMCSSEVEITCSNECEKPLECGIHKCKDKCHVGDCKPCTEVLHQSCFCNKETRDVTCSSEFKGNETYSCDGICDKTLRCGNHKCLEICHGGTCKPCSKDCSLIKTCFCGKKPLEAPRKSCLDPIPSCGWLCQKTLKCGPGTEHHKCESLCHDGDCPPCNLSTVLRCRCGSMNKEIPCHKLTDDDGRCERKCTKKRLCGKHKCNQRCCIEIEHICPLPCNRILSCGNHRCELTCHSGRCKPCIETSFEELYCECGSQVMYPPIPCGTKPPICNKPCSRSRACGHEVNHACHIGPCPPCTVLCKRWCYGNHEQRGAIPCHQEDFSCGLPCGKPMPCGRHKCNSPCHLGSCPVPCKQPCLIERSSCGHPCLAACHEPPCPQTVCRSKVSVACTCGIQKGVRSCNDVSNEMRNIELAQMSEKMLNMSKNQTVDISDMGSKPKRPDILKILECTEECRVIERNRRLAIGLQIRNPDISQKLTPRYSDFMRGWAKKDSHFCQRIHDKLTELVQLAKQSQQRSRSHSFESMNRDKRQFVHEYCEHFGCDSEAYDAEPNRNVVATAIRDKSWLPSMSLLEVIQRENGQRKVPMPSHLERNLSSKSESVTLKPLNRTVRSGVSMNDLEYSKK